MELKDFVHGLTAKMHEACFDISGLQWNDAAWSVRFLAANRVYAAELHELREEMRELKRERE